MSFGWPCDPDIEITQNFGSNPNSVQPDGHTGMDFGCAIGSNLYSVADGIILVSDWADNVLGPNNVYGLAVTSWLGRSGGIIVIIDHGDIISIYAHMSDAPLNAGDRVKRGQLIGKSGDTGYTFGAHLHFEMMVKPLRWAGVRWYGRVNPLNYISKEAAPALSSSQRVTGAAGAKYRPEPNTSKAETQVFAAGDVLNFVGWVHGESVNGTDIWLKGTGGGFVHVSAVEPMTEKGLPDLNPKAPAPAPAAPALSSSQRVTGAAGAKYRPEPNTSKKETQVFAAGDVLNFVGWVHGESVNGTDIWLKGIGGGFVHVSAVEPMTEKGLPDLNAKPAPVVTAPPVVAPKPTPTPVPTPPVYTPPVVKDTFKGDLPCITEWIPAGEGNFEVGNFPEFPTTTVVHDYGTHGRDTYESSVAHFKQGNRDNPSSAHVIISWDHITQMVRFFGPERCRAYGAGPTGNDFIQVELDPEISTGSAKGEQVKANARLFFQQLFDKYGYKLKLIEHNSLMNTLCGDDIDLAWFADIDVTPKASAPKPIPKPTPVPAPVTPAPVVKTSFEDVAKTLEQLASQFRKL